MRKIIGTLMLAGATALLSLPAVAAPPPPPPQPHVQFGLTFGTSPPPHQRFVDPSDDDDCMSTNEILADVRSMGYRSIRFLDDDGDVLTVRARLGYKRYILELDDCSGDLVSRRRIYN